MFKIGDLVIITVDKYQSIPKGTVGTIRHWVTDRGGIIRKFGTLDELYFRVGEFKSAKEFENEE